MGRWLRKVGWVLVIACPLAAGAWTMAQRNAEEGVLRRATAQFQHGEWQAATATLEPLHRRSLLSVPARRRAAELYFRLGEDQKGHRLLLGLKFQANDPTDARLKEWVVRSQRAEALIRRANGMKSPLQRFELTKQAHDELPEAPHVLQRLVREELALMLKDPKSEAASRFEEDYTQLRLAAPQLATEVRSEAEALAGEVR
jgi:hypothetical protein